MQGQAGEGPPWLQMYLGVSSDSTLGDPADQKPRTWLGRERDGEQMLGGETGQTCLLPASAVGSAFLSQPGVLLWKPVLLILFLVLS